MANDEAVGDTAHFHLVHKLMYDVGKALVYTRLATQGTIPPRYTLRLWKRAGLASYPSMYRVETYKAILASHPDATIPTEVHLMGEGKSMTGIAEISAGSRAGPIDLMNVSIGTYKANVAWKPGLKPER
ncbi:hypothetical protein CEK25_008861 [Fusarium fujikuroi]|nr:hypothetical protein CEK25_008861 [Fusarium fujikuroi]